MFLKGDKKVRVGVVGLGMGKIHIKGFQSHPAAKIAAVCDTNTERLQSVAREFGIKQTYTDALKMFSEAKLDAVSIATPNKFHAPLTIAALKAGLHVLCEKPMAMNTGEAERMRAAARKSGKNLMINFSYRFSNMSYALKQQVDAGIIGEIYFGRTVWHRRRGIPGFGGWFCDKELAGGGPLIDLGVHRLDLALWLMGYPEPSRVTGSVYNAIAHKLSGRKTKKYTVEDLACAMIKFKNGATLILEASWALNIKEPEYMETILCGDKGGLVQKNVDGGYNFIAEVYTEEGGNLFTKTLDEAITPAPTSFHEFVNSILEKREPLTTAEEGIKVMQILDAIYQSAETGKEVCFQ